MAANRDLLNGLRGLYLPELGPGPQGAAFLSDERGPGGMHLPLHGGYAWTGGALHFDGTAWADAPYLSWLSLRPGERLTILADFAPTAISSPFQLAYHHREWEFQSYGDGPGTLYYYVYTSSSLYKFAGQTGLTNARHFAAGMWDGAHLFAQVDAGAPGLTQGDALSADSFVFANGLAPVQIGRSWDGTTAGAYFQGTLYRLGFWVRYQAGLSQAEIDAFRTGGDLFVSGRRRNRSPLYAATSRLVQATPDPAYAVFQSDYRTGPGGIRLRQYVSGASDIASDLQLALSRDDGATFTAPVDAPWISQDVTYSGDSFATVTEFGVPTTWHAPSGKTLGVWGRQMRTSPDGRYHLYSYLRASDDYGQSWNADPPLFLTYSPGGVPFIPTDPLNASFIDHSEAYTVGLTVLSDGRVFIPGGWAHDPTDVDELTRNVKQGAVCWLLTYADGIWSQVASNQIGLSVSLSYRGVFEPVALELTRTAGDIAAGQTRVLVLYRGDNNSAPANNAPAVKYYTIATIAANGSVTLTPFAEWTWADGGQFWCGSTSHAFRRDPRTGQAEYWGQVLPYNTHGDLPRDLFGVGLIDETVPGVIRDTFSVLSARQFGETGASEHPLGILIDRYLSPVVERGWTNLGHLDPAHTLAGDAIRDVNSPTVDAVNAITVPSAAADYVLFTRGGACWNRVAAQWQALDNSRRYQFAVGVTPSGGSALGNLPIGMGAGPLTALPFTMAGLAPASGDTALTAVVLAAETVPDPPKGSASAGLGPAGSAGTG